MKSNKRIVLALTAAIVISVSGNAPTQALNPEVRSYDPVIVRADVVYSDDATESFNGGLVRARNGDLVESIGTRGDGMPSLEVANKLIRSSDLGKTWSKPYMTSKTAKPLTGLGEFLHNLPGGRILRYSLELVWPGEPDQAKPDYEMLAGGRKFDSYFSISEDNGYTFSERKPLTDPASNRVKRMDFAQGNIAELPNGDLLWSWGDWGTPPLNGFKRSTDGGRNWSPMVRAYQDPPPGFVKPLYFNETAVAVCKDGSIVAVARVDGAPDNDKRFWQIKSSDNAKTWTTPRQIEIIGGSPALYCTPKGQLWLAYRDGGVGPGLGLAVSDDNGGTWRFLYHLKEPKGNHEKLYGQIRYTDADRKKPWRPAEGQVGYPSFAKLSDTEVYVVYNAASYPSARTFYIAGNLLQIPAHGDGQRNGLVPGKK